MPIVYDFLDTIAGSYVRDVHKDPYVWFGHAVASILFGVSTYYVLNKYTPGNKYKWG